MSRSSHLMELPQRVMIGAGVLDELGRFIDESGVSSKRVVFAAGTNVQAKVRERLSAVLPSAMWVDVLEPDEGNVRKVMRASSRKTCIVGLGGGKSVDVGKLAAYRTKLPFFSVPTSASHDGIASPFASISGTGKHYSIQARPPVGILADIDIIADAPLRLHAAGCGDLVSKLTAVKDWKLSHDETGEYYGEYAANLALMSATVILNGSKSMGSFGRDAIRVLVEALISAGVAAGIAGSSRPCSGAEHLFSHYLDGRAPDVGMHGEKCGIGTVMIAKLYGIDFGKIRRALKDVHAPTTASEIGLSDGLVVEALVNAPSVRPDRYTILSKAKLTEKKAKEVAREAGVI